MSIGLAYYLIMNSCNWKGNMMTRLELPIKDLTFAQKLDLMETLCADMIGNDKNLEAPAWHEPILNDREAAFKAGKITASD